jgi:hypothetical protein
MIFQGRDAERHFARLSQLVAKSAIAPVDDRYLFLLWHWDESKLKSYLFVKQDDVLALPQKLLAHDALQARIDLRRTRESTP